MKLGIVLFPSKKLQDLANSYRKRYDPHYSLIAPHLTLNIFESSETEIKEITKDLRSIASKTNPFPLTVQKFSSFAPVNNVIYLKVDPNEGLINLYESLRHGKLKTETEYAFVPHITIGQKLSNDEHSDVFGSLRMTKVQHNETIDRFHLLYQLDNGSWTVYETFLLGKGE